MSVMDTIKPDELNAEARKQAMSLYSGEPSVYRAAIVAGYITFDDLVYVQFVNCAASAVLRRKVQQGTLDETEMEKDPTIEEEAYILVSSAHGCTLEEAQERFYAVHRKVAQYHNFPLSELFDLEKDM